MIYSFPNLLADQRHGKYKKGSNAKKVFNGHRYPFIRPFKSGFEIDLSSCYQISCKYIKELFYLPYDHF